MCEWQAPFPNSSWQSSLFVDRHTMLIGNRDDVVVRALTFHQNGLASIPGPGIISGLSLLGLLSALGTLGTFDLI